MATKKLLDTGSMRAAAFATLDRDEQVPKFDELTDRSDRPRGYLRKLILAVETAAQTPHGDAVDRGTTQPEIHREFLEGGKHGDWIAKRLRPKDHGTNEIRATSVDSLAQKLEAESEGECNA